jgi:hypothetical protein
MTNTIAEHIVGLSVWDVVGDKVWTSAECVLHCDLVAIAAREIGVGSADKRFVAGYSTNLRPFVARCAADLLLPGFERPPPLWTRP